MEIKQEDNGQKGKFYVDIDGKLEAEMTYTYAGKGKIIIDHTEVSEKLKGQGVGLKVLDAAVAFIRKNSLKVIPLCPFANAVIKKNRKAYEDILA